MWYKRTLLTYNGKVIFENKKERYVNSILKGICIRMYMTMLQLKEEICVTLHLGKDINI